MGKIVAIVNKKGENATKTVFAMLEALRYEKVKAFGVASPKKVEIERTFDTLKSHDLNSPLIVGYIFSRILAKDKPQPIQIENRTMVFDGRTYPMSREVSDAENFAEKFQKQQNFAKTVIKESEGGFAFAVAESGKLTAGRDSMGVRPLYYGENTNFAVLASERKALWIIEIKNAISFPSGNLALIDKNGFKFKPVTSLKYSHAKRTSMKTAAKQLQTLLQQSVKNQVSGLKDVALAFSGGVDSSVLAYLAKKSGVNVHLMHVSLGKQPEIEEAKKAAEELMLPIHVYQYTEDDVEKTLPKVLWLIEEPDPVKASIGIPIFWISEQAAKMGVKIVLAGQGADELFGGYKKYVDRYLKYGEENVRKTIFNDICRMYETNLERDFKIANYHNIEMRLPFVTYQIAKFAAELPLELKIEMKDSGLRKLVLRKVAENLGLTQFIVKKPKKAIQYATGVNKTLKKLANKQRLSVKEYLQRTFREVFKEIVKYE